MEKSNPYTIGIYGDEPVKFCGDPLTLKMVVDELNAAYAMKQEIIKVMQDHWVIMEKAE